MPARTELAAIGPPSAEAARVEYWAQKIEKAWRETVQGILDVGTLLVKARGDIEERGGDFGELVGRVPHPQRLPFGFRAAYQLMAVARDQRFVPHVGQLPPSWGTLYQLTRLKDDEFNSLLRDGVIRPDLERGEIAKIRRLARVQEDEARVLNLRPVEGKFRTIILDPAWEYDWLSIAGRAKPDYAMQTVDQLQALDVKAWADESAGVHIYLWTTNNFMAGACRLLQCWGFQHRTLITWIKPPPFGLGWYFRNSTEHVLFATLGDTTTRPAAASLPTHFTAPRGEHSEKPEKFYEVVRAASYPPYGEANQREPRADFTNLFEQKTRGNEVTHSPAKLPPAPPQHDPPSPLADDRFGIPDFLDRRAAP